MSDCLFCKIAGGEIPSQKVYEDELVYAFYDIDPQAPTHFLVIPKAHIASCGEITAENSAVVAHCFEVISKVTKERVPPALPRAGGTGHDLAAGMKNRSAPALPGRSPIRIGFAEPGQRKAGKRFAGAPWPNWCQGVSFSG